MRIGLFTPVVVQHPGSSSPWEATATVDDLSRIAETADRLGYHYMTCSEHVAVPTDVVAERGGTYWDPLATFGFLAARTNRIAFATQVLVLGYHHPLEVAKRYGTLDVVSGGRLILGVGVGSLREEFDLLGARFDGRGPVADDAMRALRASLGQREPRYSGEHFDFSDITVSPAAVQRRVPLWVGGRSLRSLRRATGLGDGWVPFGLDHDAIAGMLARVDVPNGFEVVLSTGAPLDPMADPTACHAALDSVRGIGATVATATLTARSAEHYCEQVEALAELGRDAGVDLG
ncbi:MAG TPA: TIGR03619 family F420-dependent LLM class oxidoreductase [Candidatus Dietzia intestinipullorum]|nr:TIGR03619 family F420-dependent LLM class oxidoreductase [Candidatus Dietzia merdigallinarum]HJC28692.1 TIGR03619 family F420-dependent LLM class oxidoreductase [Candidatus Dietzia intestinipullorum]